MVAGTVAAGPAMTVSAAEPPVRRSPRGRSVQGAQIEHVAISFVQRGQFCPMPQ
jgi:hypothetical protein